MIDCNQLTFKEEDKEGNPLYPLLYSLLSRIFLKEKYINYYDNPEKSFESNAVFNSKATMELMQMLYNKCKLQKDSPIQA